MTVSTEITRLKTSIANAYDALEAKGATIPDIENPDNLVNTIESIPEDSGEVVNAINTSSAAVAKNDKVWLNKNENVYNIVDYNNEVYNIASSDMNNVASLSRYFTPVTNNATYLSISYHSIPNFMSSLFTSSSNDFELVIKFFVNSASEHSRIFSLQTAVTPGSSFFTWCSLSEDSSSLKKISLGFTYAQNLWDDINLDTEIEDNTWYYVIYNRSSGKLSISLAKNSADNIIETVTNSRDNVVFYCSSSYTYIALAQTNSDYIPLLYDLSEVSFTSSYQNINWKALDLGNITEKTITGTAAETILSGATGNVYIGDKDSGGEQVEAVNSTSSAITSGDKVWINQDNGENKLVDYYKKGIGFSNFDVYGQLLFNSEKKVASNFSTSNYLVLPKSLTSYNTFEIRLKFKNTSLNNGCNVILANPNVDHDGITIGVASNSRLWLGLGKNNSWSIYDSNQSTSTFALDTWYYIKLVFDGSSYVLSSSTDNINWTIEHSVSTSSKVSMNKLGLGLLNNDSNYCQKGYIDLSECYIKTDDEFWWQPYEQGIQKQLSRDILINNASYSDYFVDNSGIYKPFIYSKAAYPFFNRVFKPENNTWKLITKIKTPSEDQYDNYNVLFCGQNSFFNTGFEVASAYSHNLQFGVGDGADWTIGYVVGTKVFDVNTIYWIKLEFNGSRYSLSYSLDGENYIEDCYIDSTTAIGNSGNALISIGYRDSTRYWRGEIDLSETNIEVDGKLWNDASETLTNVTADTQIGTAAENIAAGSTGLVNVGAVIEPSGSITITENGTHDVANYAEAIVNVPVPVGDKYKVGDRVKDDSNNDVGTVSSIFTDGNGDRYAVVCLDAVNRLASGYYASQSGDASIPRYIDQTVFSAPETATKNTTEILAFISAGSYTSTSCTHCRSKTFTIDGVSYAGQLPNIIELIDIFRKRTIINTQDPTATQYSSLVIPTTTHTWSSTQYNNNYGWLIGGDGSVNIYSKENNAFVIPVLEIPLED